MRSIGLGVLQILLLSLPTASQQISTHANLVPVPTLVLDQQDKTVFGLHALDFVIEDDGIQQVAHLDEEPESKPISLVVAVQCGRRASRDFARMAGLSAMLDPVLNAPNSEAAVLFFDSRLNLVDNFTYDADVVEKDLKNIESGDEGAAVLDAVAYSARLLARRPAERQRVLLLISETRDHGSRFAKMDEVVRLIGENYISVYALPFSPYLSQQLDVLRGANRDEWRQTVDILEKLAAIRQAMKKNIPETLADLSGGEYRLFHTQRSFETDLINFANNLQNRYALSFEPKNPVPGLHQIRVRLRNSVQNANVLYRTSYWAGEQDEQEQRYGSNEHSQK